MAAPPGPRDLPRIVIGVAFILLMGGASLYILQPFLPAVIWATMIVVATWPILMMLQERLRGSRALAATVMMLLLLVIVIAPLVWLIWAIVAQADSRRVVDERVEPHVHHAGGLPGQRDAPGLSRAAHRDVLESAFEKPQHLVSPRFVLTEIGMRGEVIENRLTVFGEAEKVVLLSDPLGSQRRMQRAA